jgi:hypothetical protein
MRSVLLFLDYRHVPERLDGPAVGATGVAARRDRGKRHGGGRPRKYELRRVVDALLYVVKTGC